MPFCVVNWCQAALGDQAREVAYTIIEDRRLDRGMPGWKGGLTDDVMWRIFTYLQTVQTQP